MPPYNNPLTLLVYLVVFLIVVAILLKILGVVL